MRAEQMCSTQAGGWQRVHCLGRVPVGVVRSGKMSGEQFEIKVAVIVEHAIMDLFTPIVSKSELHPTFALFRNKPTNSTSMW